ncbi:hypothetical protein GCM10010156_69700 [Planobispora rosea]|uniref:Uncharacterized protein n=1 Tax=Planobispora rosea TaxID=35762 RepID=A0A8J3S7Y2_PLARO|nr:hypothetical protein [Planobispora rosea]GGT01897.1 hypothetical protein GCM10010156_69700 [Planobispora rosea]GIH88395.1 hypothetical protein Pro02_68030 [Planobispora rosea]
MTPTMIIPVLVTTDLPPDADLATFGRQVADAVAVLPAPGGASFAGRLEGSVFWLDAPLVAPAEPGSPVPVVEELRFAAVLGMLEVDAPEPVARQVLAAARAVVAAAVTAAYGDLGSPPAVLAIRAEDVRERTPKTALPAVTTQTMQPA